MATKHVVRVHPATPLAVESRSHRPRRSSTLLLACLLALATALTLVRLSDLLAPDAPSRIPPTLPSVANAAAVRRFYADIDAVLAGGDPASLNAALAPSFVDHAAVAGRSPDRAGLADELVTLRAVFPTLRLVAMDLIAEGDEVVARVRAEQTTPAAFVGIPLPADWPVWAAVDVFRLADGQIVERWGGNVPGALLQPLRAAPLILPPADPALVVTRIEVAPGGAGVAPGTVGPSLLWVEAGAPTVTLDAVYAVRAEVTSGESREEAPAAIAPGSTVPLAAGDLVRIEDARYTVRNSESAPAVFVAVTLDANPLFSDARGVAIQTLAVIRGTALRPGPTLVAVGRATLAAGAGLPAHRVAGMELVAVEAGTAALSVGGGPAGGRQWIGQATPAPGEAAAELVTLRHGEARLLVNGVTAEIRNVGDSPLTLVVVAVDDSGHQ